MRAGAHLNRGVYQKLAAAAEDVAGSAYTVLGHGKTVTNSEGDIVYKTVPPGCVYVTFANVGETTSTLPTEILLAAIKSPEIFPLLKDPITHYDTLLRFFSLDPAMNNPVLTRYPFDELIRELRGALTIYDPGDTYPDAQYKLLANYTEGISQSGFYNVTTLKDNPMLIDKDEEYIRGPPYRRTELYRAYEGSLIPNESYISEYLSSRPTSELDTVQFAWPTVNDTFMKFINEFGTRTISDIEDIKAEFLKAAEHLGSANVKRMRSMTLFGELLQFLSTIKGVSPVSLLSTLPYTPRIYEVLNELKMIITTNTDIIPGELVTQSFLFDNYPGVHYNFICREFHEKPGCKLPSSNKVRKAKSAERHIREKRATGSKH